MSSVIVLGSINIDLVIEVPHLPMRGETVIGQKFFSMAGGKAANCAVAIARLGASVGLIGQVGLDFFGDSLVTQLRDAGVDTTGVEINPHTHTGIASIVVDRRGENTISCAAGANDLVGSNQIKALADSVGEAKMAVLELGVPLKTVMEAAQIIHASGCSLILDPAPASFDLSPQIFQLVDIITPNEIEASQLVGFTVDGTTTASQAARVLHQWGVKRVVITLGNKGVFASTGEETFWLPAVKTQVVDTVGAGDAFNGALVAALMAGKSFKEAVHWGTVAGAIAVSQSGAQSSLPTQEHFMQVLAQFPFET